MITLHKLERNGESPFVQFPSLSNIWGGDFSLQAKGATEYWQQHPEEPGEIYLIKCYVNDNTDVIVGITGWWPITDNLDRPLIACLRWHGIIPEMRGYNISVSALTLLLDKIPSASHLVVIGESEKIVKDFERIGFYKVTDPGIIDLVTESSIGDIGSNIVLAMSLPITPYESNLISKHIWGESYDV